ncbi:MAG: hypothetical protein PVSMB7_29100 [Chloroflexota bacterium]
MVHELPTTVADLRERLLPLAASIDASTDTLLDAAVLVVLYPRDDEVMLILTVRPDTLRQHGGQISLPGGRWEPHDPSLWETALREAREELGMDTAGLLPLGRLDWVHVAVSGYRVWPFVAWMPTRPDCTPDPSEVAQVIEVPVSLVLGTTAVDEEEWDLRGERWMVTFYRIESLIVWGATARILADLAGRIHGVPAAEPRPGSVRRAPPRP